jgi:hypothetical protein
MHNVDKIYFREKRLFLHVDEREYVFELERISQRLFNASQPEREKFEISPSGYGIHWPLIDEDLSIDGLIGINHVPLQKPVTRVE